MSNLLHGRQNTKFVCFLFEIEFKKKKLDNLKFES